MPGPKQGAASRRVLPAALRRAAFYLPVLLAVLLMLPRLAAPQFGLFDDGRTLVTAEKISHGTWYTGQDSVEGRFRPVHWLWFTLSYLVGGKDPLWFYVANTLALVAIVAGLIFLVRAVGGSRFQAFLAGLLFILTGPVVESFFTLKGEVLQLALMVFALLAALLYRQAKARLQKAGVVALTTLLLLLADLTKETAIVLLPVSLAWYLLARFWPGYEDEAAKRAARGAYLLANLLAVPLFFLARGIAFSAQISEGTYSGQYTFQPAQIAVSMLRWAGWLLRDFAWAAPLILLALVLWIARRKVRQGALLMDSLVWMGAWICIYLPWNFMAEYYMLPFALGLAVLVAALMAEITAALRGGGWKRATALLLLGLGGVLLAGDCSNNLTDARLQLAVDSTNASMLKYLVENAEPGSTVLVNIQYPNEYFYEMQTQLGEVYGRPDLNVLAFHADMSLAEAGGPVYIVSPFVANEPLLTVRMGVVESTQNIWNDNLHGFLQTRPGGQVVYAAGASFRLAIVDYPRAFCPLIKTRFFCATPAPLVDTRRLDYGWKIYKLSGS